MTDRTQDVISFSHVSDSEDRAVLAHLQLENELAGSVCWNRALNAISVESL